MFLECSHISQGPDLGTNLFQEDLKNPGVDDQQAAMVGSVSWLVEER